ncbi:MAG TPA: class I SAM-dependent methyltransferase [Mycobacteriales bacterium]|nr:class I SAM-dependent methyltransferase [Mycobacteriales bacterium]
MGWYEDRVLPRLINKVLDTSQTRQIRERVASGLSGEVLEIGFGSGLNLPYLPAAVTGLKAVDPSGGAARLAHDRIEASPIAVEFIGLDGQQIPLPDSSVDTVLSTWTLCTIPDAVTAIREIGRVLRPGGTLHFVEHGRADEPGVLRWQNRLNGLQQRLAGGCNLNRDISGIVEAGGLTMRQLDRFYGPGQPKAFGALYEGVAAAT